MKNKNQSTQPAPRIELSKLTKQELEKFCDGIRSTGFPLEYWTLRVLQNHGWTIIGNKYYLDDHTESAREMDLLAYRTQDVGGLLVVTTLLVSCKKSDKNAWALLAKAPERSNVNLKYTPTHTWTNHKAIAYEVQVPGWEDAYYDFAASHNVGDALRRPNVDVFAVREMDLATGRQDNDKEIFASISALMKAQAYEMSVLGERYKTAKRVYQFNLLTVLDGELLRIDFGDKSLTPVPVDSEQYVARYIVDRRQVFARIHIVKKEAFEKCVPFYGRLHESNCEHFRERLKEFYANVLKDYKRLRVFQADFIKDIRWLIDMKLDRILPSQGERDADLFWRAETDTLTIAWETSPEALAQLSKDRHLMDHIARKLKAHFKYEGAFEFSCDTIPF